MPTLKRFILLAGVILLSMQVTYADVIYRETFSRPAGAANTNFSYVGWTGYWSATAQASDSPLFGPANNNFAVGSSLGRPSGGSTTNVNAGASDGNTNGFAFASGQLAVSNNILVTTSEYTVDQSVWNIGSLSFYAGNTTNNFPNGMPGYRFAIQMDGNWYATASNFVQTVNVAAAANFPTTAQQMVFNWTNAASAWLSLNFTPGTTLTLGGPIGSDLPADPITAFGLYSDPAVNTNGVGGTATRRWDTFEIDGTAAIPEPSSIALVLVGLGTLVGLRRSRKT